jgi:hypothetical protein
MEKKVITPKEIIDQSMINVMGYDVNIYAVFLLIIFAIFLIALWRAQKSQRLDWLDMLTRDGRKVSTTKVLQLIGGVVGTWIIIQVTLQGVLTWDLFAIYLAYVASIDGFSKLILARYGVEGSDDTKAPYRQWTGSPHQPRPPNDAPVEPDKNQPAGAAKANLD